MPAGTVLWFNPTKGFGFIKRDGGGKDVFIHVNEIKLVGRTEVREGQRIAFEVDMSPKGKPTAKKLNLLDIPVGKHQESGTVKWFDPRKGYGFIVPGCGGGDVFLHISAVERAGRTALEQGESVGFTRVQQNDGKICATELSFGHR